MRVAIFTGPTGGHFYPALAFSEALQKFHPEARLLFVTGERGRPLVEKAHRTLEGEFGFLPDFPFPRLQERDFLIRLFPFLLQLARAFLKSRKMLNSFGADLTVGFGSYVSFPGLRVSRGKKIPTLIHEQNRRMGRANAGLARWVDSVALSFEENGIDSPSPKRIVTGLPLRSALVARSFGKDRSTPPLLSPNRFRILVVGGSQGARSLNRLWISALESFSDEEKQKLAVIHITGEKDSEGAKAMYFKKGIEALVLAFHERMEELYPEADLALTRAGAGTLFELALFGLPGIVLPYPHAEGHQELNARYFSERGALRLLLENEATPERLKQEILELMNSEALRTRMSENLKRLARPDASERLVKAAESLLEKKGEVS